MGIFPRFKEPWETGIGVLEDSIFEQMSFGLVSTEISQLKSSGSTAVSLPIRYRPNKETQSKAFGEISGNGIRIAHGMDSQRPKIPVESSVDLEIKFPGKQEWFKIKGWVIYSCMSQMAGMKSQVEYGIALENLKAVKNKETMVPLLANKIISLALNYPAPYEIRPVQKRE